MLISEEAVCPIAYSSEQQARPSIAPAIAGLLSPFSTVSRRNLPRPAGSRSTLISLLMAAITAFSSRFVPESKQIVIDH
jgi:hypothetical protein